VLVLITAAKGSLKLKESQLAMNTIRAYASPDAHIIYGAAYDDAGRQCPRHRGCHRLEPARACAASPSVVQVGLRTGTDNLPASCPRLNHNACSNAPSSP
jgi:cell division protein FtsZ